MEKLINSIAAKISPDSAEANAEKRVAQEIIAKLSKALPQATLSFVGSAARDTGLKGDRDIDLFAKFPKHLSKEEIVEKTVKATKKSVSAKWVMHYAEHPYLKTVIKGFQVEVIPCFDLQPHEEIKSAVDRSPLHMDYLEKHLTVQQKRDVRVLKQLLKNNALYGAELAIEGFSGIMCEYLVLNYRSFPGVVENAGKWQPPVRIELTPSDKKFETPLVLIDAIDKNRNVAAVISETNVNRFIALCREFCKKPSRKFFFTKQPKYSKKQVLASMKKRGTFFLLTQFNAPDLVEDILFPQLKKTEKSLARQLTLRDFKLIGSSSWLEGRSCGLLFEAEHQFLPLVKKVHGPKVSNEIAVKEFLKKKPMAGPFIENDAVMREQERRWTDCLAAFLDLKKSGQKAGIASSLITPLKKSKATKQPLASQIQKTGEYLFKKEQWW